MTPAQDETLHRIHDAAPIYLRLTGTGADIKTSDEADYHGQPALTFDEFVLYCAHPKPDGTIDVVWSDRSLRIGVDGSGAPADLARQEEVAPVASKRPAPALVTRFLARLLPWQLGVGAIVVSTIELAILWFSGFTTLQGVVMVLAGGILSALLTGIAAARNDATMLLVALIVHLAGLVGVVATVLVP